MPTPLDDAHKEELKAELIGLCATAVSEHNESRGPRVLDLVNFFYENGEDPEDFLNADQLKVATDLYKMGQEIWRRGTEGSMRPTATRS